MLFETEMKTSLLVVAPKSIAVTQTYRGFYLLVYISTTTVFNMCIYLLPGSVVDFVLNISCPVQNKRCICYRNTEEHGGASIDVALAEGHQKIKKLKARAILVDMEEGVINELLQGHLGEVCNVYCIAYNQSCWL